MIKPNNNEHHKEITKTTAKTRAVIFTTKDVDSEPLSLQRRFTS